MAGLSPKLPLSLDGQDTGYFLIKDFKDLVQQNLKMLILTNPGERIMDPDFGVGLRTFLFEQNTPGTYSQIESKIRSQVGIYLSYLKIINIRFDQQSGLGNPSGNLLNIKIRYFVEPLQVEGDISFEFNFDLDNIPTLV